MLLIRMLLVAMAVGGAMCGVPAEASVDAKSNAILNGVSAQLAGAKTAEVELRLRVRATNGPAPLGELNANYSLAIERPNKMALVLKEGALGATVVCDGTNTITFVPKPPMFTVRKASKQIGGVDLAAQTADMGSMAFITAMFSENPRAALLAGVVEAKYGGREKIDGVECDRVNMKQEGLDWRLFTTTAEKPSVRRIEVAIPQQLDLSMDFSGWKLNAAIANERFKFVPPPDAKKVDKLLDEEEKEGEDSDLVDEPLPKLKLKTLEGDVFDTAALKGHPTLLVVWSGEAEHCLNALKATMELAAAKKLAIYSINIDEKPDKLRIKNFLKANKLNVKTAVDDNREAVEKLEMEGVPTTFLIDKAGVIRKAYLGYHKDFKTLLEKEIVALQAEKK